MSAPDRHRQLQRTADLIPERGQDAWFWHGAGLDLVRCIGRAVIRSPAGDAPACSVVLHGRVLIVPADRITPVPRVDRDFRLAAP